MHLTACLLALGVSGVLAQFEPNVVAPRSVYTHLFEWKWTDIAQECERFLGPKGYGAVQISPPHEHWLESNPWRPWDQRYKPISYKLLSRSGNEQEFRDMVERCNAVDVRIYVDVVFNHMCPGSGVGSGGSTFNNKNFPAIPYGPNDFTPRSSCPSFNGGIYNYGNPTEVRNCELLGMPDLAIYQPYVQEKIVEYLNRLVDIGVAGFRVDASKHMWPAHLETLFGKVKDLNPRFFPNGGRPYVYHEVIDLGGEPIKGTEYHGSGRVQEFKYGMHLSRVVQKQGGEQLRFLKNFGEGWGMMTGLKAVAFLDNHDNQRGHGAGGNLVTFRNPRLYKIANAFMLAWPYGFPQVMSSYHWTQNYVNGHDINNLVGPPSDSAGNTNSVIVNPDDSCGGGWVCEHRWRQIYNMVRFRNVAGLGAVVHWWDNGANQIAFGRGKEKATTAFLVINNDGYPLNQNLQTGLPAGSYCDVISGNLVNGACTGKTITVGGDGNAFFSINNSDEDPMVALHTEARL